MGSESPRVPWRKMRPGSWQNGGIVSSHAETVDISPLPKELCSRSCRQHWKLALSKTGTGLASFLPGAASWGLVHLLLDPGGPSVLLEASLVSIAQGLHTGSLSHGEIMTLAERTLTHYSCDENCNHGICAITKDQEVDMVILTMPLICLWL